MIQKIRKIGKLGQGFINFHGNQIKRLNRNISFSFAKPEGGGKKPSGKK